MYLVYNIIQFLSNSSHKKKEARRSEVLFLINYPQLINIVNKFFLFFACFVYLLNSIV